MLILSSKHGCFPEGGSLFLILLLVLLTPGFSRAQDKTPSSGGPIIVCMIQPEHADAEYLATVLKPSLSPQGIILPYKTTNPLITTDRAPVVNILAEMIKAKPSTPVL